MKKIILIALAAFCSTFVLAQSKVTGTVTSADDGQPIPFATIQVKGMTTGEYSDDNGKYSISVPADGILVVSAMGFTTQEVPVNGKAVINVALKTDAIALDETIVVAYGTAKKGSFTGSASSLKADLIENVPATSFEQALSGRIPGLQMTPGSGQAGSTVNIRIRGTGSMNATNEPLYVIDGVPVISGDVTSLSQVSNNVMNTLNPGDIENITVLKDAAASSLYGSRAANGVVLITTKSGKQGKIRLNFKANVGFTPDFAYKNNEKASPADQRILRYETFYNGQIAHGATAQEAAAYAQKQLDAYIPLDPRGEFDWEKALFRTAVFQNYDLSASGGTEETKYFVSFAYTDEQGRVKANDMSRWSGRVNVSQKMFKIAELTSNISYSAVEKSGFNDTYSNGDNYYLLAKNLTFGEWWPTKPDGTPVTERFRSYGYNVLYYDDYRENTSKMNRLSINESLSLRPLESLTLKTIFSYDDTRVDDYAWRAAIHYGGASKNGTVDSYYRKMIKMVSTTTANWAKTLNEKHNINLLAGFEAEKNKTDYMRASGTDLPTLSSKTVATAGVKDATAYYWGNNMLSVFSRAEYNYDNRYYVSGSYRRDGSSKLSKDTRWGNFWSVSGSWKINNENFLKNVQWLSNLRIKGSYGVNGTLPDPNYGHIALYNFGYNYNSKPGGVVSTIADNALTWETNYTYNIGLETGFFDNRLTAAVEYYNRDSKDLLQDVPISSVTGFGSILTNFGAINNQGFEIEVGGDIIRNKNVRWNLALNISTLKSKVTKLFNDKDIIWDDPTGGDGQAQFIYRVGESAKSFWGKEYAGVDPDNGNPMWYLNKDRKDYGASDLYKTINGRDVTTNSSKAADVVTGCADPKLYGGISTDVSWKGLALSLAFSYSLGGDAYNAMEKYMNDDGYFSWRTMSTKALERWQKPGDITSVPKRIYDEGFIGNQSRWLYKNNYLRLKNITLSYNLPKHIVSKARLSNVRVFFSGVNLLTFCSQDQFDPEVSVYGVTSWQMPIGKTYTFGIEIGL